MFFFKRINAVNIIGKLYHYKSGYTSALMRYYTANRPQQKEMLLV